jgi:PTH1 family peptidyl-tRNA hydrolase
MFLVAGLGNPGSTYSFNWHNCGFMALEVLAQRNKIPLKKNKFQGEYGKGKIAGVDTVLLRPHTFMNLSGDSIREAMAFFKIPADHVIVIVDDVDIPLGTVRTRGSGGPGTHNGMKSAIERIGTPDFPRVRIGIGPAPEYMDLAAFVLSDIPEQHRETMFEAFVEASQVIEKMIGDDR